MRKAKSSYESGANVDSKKLYTTKVNWRRLQQAYRKRRQWDACHAWGDWSGGMVELQGCSGPLEWWSAGVAAAIDAER